MRKSLLVGAVALLMLSLSCKKDSNLTGPSSQSPPLSEGQRAIALQGVEEALASVSHQSMSVGNATLLAYLRSQSIFAAAGIADTGANVWARFTDGRLLIIANNRPVSGDTSSPESPMSQPRRVGGSPAGNLPGSNKARVMSAMGTWFVDPTGVLTSLLSSRGYVVTPERGTVDNLLHVNGDGVFYFDSHGGNGWRRDSTEIIALWTATPRSPERDNAYMGMLDADELCYFTAKNDRSGDTATIETHYGITNWFVLQHMSFGRDCLIYIDACRSFVNNFILSCISKSENNTGTFVSWSNYVDDSKAYKVMKFVVDRLLGANYQNIPWIENPPQRPFDIDLLWQDMEGRTPPINRYSDNSVPGNAQVATLRYRRDSNIRFILAPSIKFLSVNEVDRKLYVEGSFGTDPRSNGTGIVTVNEHPLTIQDWSEDEIICSIPPSGTSAAGDVVVEVRGHKSNVVRLTEWIGEVRQILASGWAGINITVTYALHLRADMHSFRERPGETPQALSQILTRGAPDAHGDWSLGGQAVARYRLEPCGVVATETWASASGSLPMFPPLTVEDGVLLECNIRPRARTMTLILGSRAANSISWNGVDTITCSGQSTVYPTSGVAGFSTQDTVELFFAPNFDIVAITPIQHPNGLNPWHFSAPPPIPTGLTTIECAGIHARFPPDPTAGQRPQVSAGGIR